MEIKSGIIAFSINLYPQTAKIIIIYRTVHKPQISGNKKK